MFVAISAAFQFFGCFEVFFGMWCQLFGLDLWQKISPNHNGNNLKWHITSEFLGSKREILISTLKILKVRTEKSAKRAFAPICCILSPTKRTSGVLRSNHKAEIHMRLTEERIAVNSPKPCHFCQDSKGAHNLIMLFAAAAAAPRTRSSSLQKRLSPNNKKEQRSKNVQSLESMVRGIKF